jgi:hypothetical protein
VGLAASIGFTVALFLATAASRGGAALAETKMGALLSPGAAPLATIVARIIGTSARDPTLDAPIHMKSRGG